MPQNVKELTFLELVEFAAWVEAQDETWMVCRGRELTAQELLDPYHASTPCRTLAEYLEQFDDPEAEWLRHIE